MAEGSSGNELDQMKELLDKLEGAEIGAEVREWLETITNEEFGLVDSMIKNFLDQSDLIELSNSLLRILRQLHDHIPQRVSPQMKRNKEFPKALAKYITSHPVSDVSGDGFLLISEVFSTEGFSDVINESFTNSLFDGLDVIKDNQVFNAIVTILVLIENQGGLESENLVLRACSQHPNARYFAETLLHLINRGEEESMEDILKCTLDVFSYKETSSGFFYTNDLKSFIDILLRNVGNTSDQVLRVLYLKILRAIIFSPDFSKIRHRTFDMSELFNEIIFNEELDQESRDVAQNVLEQDLLQSIHR